MNIQMSELAQLGPRSLLVTKKGQIVQPTPIRGTMKNSYRISNGHTYVWCEFLERVGSFDWVRKDRIEEIKI